MDSDKLIHDSRKVPAWIGVPVFFFGLGALWLAAEIVSSQLFGIHLPPFSGGESGSPMLGFICTLGLGVFFISVPFMRNRIFYDSSYNQVLIRHTGLFGRSKRQLPLGAATGVEVEVGHGAHGSVHWNIWIRFSDSKREWLTQIGSVDEADGVGRTLSEAAHIQLLKT